MATYHALPPHRSLNSEPITATQAQELIALYLDRSKDEIYLHPDALLTPEGVQFPVQNSSTGLDILRRVEAGLRGERLEPEPEEADQNGEEEQEVQDLDRDGSDNADQESELHNPQPADLEDTDIVMVDEEVITSKKKQKKQKTHKQDSTMKELQQQGWQFEEEPDTTPSEKYNLEEVSQDPSKRNENHGVSAEKDSSELKSEPSKKSLSKEKKRALKEAKKALKRAAQENSAPDKAEKKRKKEKEKEKQKQKQEA